MTASDAALWSVMLGHRLGHPAHRVVTDQDQHRWRSTMRFPTTSEAARAADEKAKRLREKSNHLNRIDPDKEEDSD